MKDLSERTISGDVLDPMHRASGTMLRVPRADPVGQAYGIEPLAATLVLERLTNEIANVAMSLHPSAQALEELAQNEPLAIEHARIVAGAVDRLARYVLDVNTLTQQTQRSVATLPLSILEQLVREHLPRIAPNVRFVSRVAQNLWAVDLSEADLRCLCVQLIDNALAATRQGGEVRFEAESVQLREASVHSLPPGDFLRIRVVDNGAGMSEADLARARDPFFTTWGRHSHWTGLGLTQVDRIARRASGRLDIHSRLGKGTVATVLLRRSGNRTDTTADPRASTPLLPSSHFLIVDDEPLVLASLSRSLTQLGHEVHLAQDAPTALAILNEGIPCHFAVIDVHLGQGSGVTLAREIAATHPEIRVALASGFHGTSTIFEEQPEQSQVFLILQKPFLVDDLLTLLAQGGAHH